MNEGDAPKPPRPDGWGWLRGRPDIRDLRYAPARAIMRGVPPAVNLRQNFDPPAWDQGAIGSCVAQATAYAFMFARDKLRYRGDWVPSRLFIYYHARVRIGAPTYDGGCYIRDAFDVLRKLGAPPESYWPHKPVPSDPATWQWRASDFPAKQPNTRAHTEAAKHQALAYKRITQDLISLKSCLAEGYPFVFGTMIYSNLYGPSGEVRPVFPLPTGRDYPLGGHAMACIGYDDARNCFLIRNSWGTDVGERGHQWMPYAYMLDPALTDDLWTLQSVEDRVPGIQ